MQADDIELRRINTFSIDVPLVNDLNASTDTYSDELVMKINDLRPNFSEDYVIVFALSDSNGNPIDRSERANLTLDSVVFHALSLSNYTNAIAIVYPFRTFSFPSPGHADCLWIMKDLVYMNVPRQEIADVDLQSNFRNDGSVVQGFVLSEKLIEISDFNATKNRPNRADSVVVYHPSQGFRNLVSLNRFYGEYESQNTRLWFKEDVGNSLGLIANFVRRHCIRRAPLSEMINLLHIMSAVPRDFSESFNCRIQTKRLVLEIPNTSMRTLSFLESFQNLKDTERIFLDCNIVPRGLMDTFYDNNVQSISVNPSRVPFEVDGDRKVPIYAYNWGYEGRYPVDPSVENQLFVRVPDGQDPNLYDYADGVPQDSTNLSCVSAKWIYDARLYKGKVFITFNDLGMNDYIINVGKKECRDGGYTDLYDNMAIEDYIDVIEQRVCRAVGPDENGNLPQTVFNRIHFKDEQNNTLICVSKVLFFREKPEVQVQREPKRARTAVQN